MGIGKLWSFAWPTDVSAYLSSSLHLATPRKRLDFPGYDMAKSKPKHLQKTMGGQRDPPWCLPLRLLPFSEPIDYQSNNDIAFGGGGPYFWCSVQPLDICQQITDIWVKTPSTVWLVPWHAKYTWSWTLYEHMSAYVCREINRNKLIQS